MLLLLWKPNLFQNIVFIFHLKSVHKVNNILKFLVYVILNWRIEHSESIHNNVRKLLPTPISTIVITFLMTVPIKFPLLKISFTFLYFHFLKKLFSSLYRSLNQLKALAKKIAYWKKFDFLVLKNLPTKFSLELTTSHLKITSCSRKK